MPNFVSPIQGRPVVDITVDGRALLQTTQIAFDSAVRTDSLDSWNTWVLKLKAVTRTAYEALVVPLNLTRERRVKLRWGIDTGSATVWMPWENFRVLRTIPQLTSSTASTAGMPFELTLVDQLYDLNLAPKIASRRGTVTEIASQIAANYGLSVEVEPVNGAPLALIQSGVTDYQFLLRLCDLASTTAGSGYHFYLEGTTLHFHSRDWRKVPQVLPYNTLARTGASDLIAVDDVQDNAVQAGPDSRSIVYDPLSGRTHVLSPSAELYTRFGPRLSQAAGGALMTAHAGPNQVTLEQTRLQAAYTFARDRYERISFALTNVLTVRSGSIVSLQMSEPTDSLSGVYHVEAVKTTIVGGSAQLAVTAARGEVGGTPLDTAIVQDAGQQTLPATLPAAAPGANPRFIEVPDSQSGSAVVRSGS